MYWYEGGPCGAPSQKRKEISSALKSLDLCRNRSPHTQHQMSSRDVRLRREERYQVLDLYRNPNPPRSRNKKEVSDLRRYFQNKLKEMRSEYDAGLEKVRKLSSTINPGISDPSTSREFPYHSRDSPIDPHGDPQPA